MGLLDVRMIRMVKSRVYIYEKNVSLRNYSANTEENLKKALG